MLPFLPDSPLTFWLFFSFARALASCLLLQARRVRIIALSSLFPISGLTSQNGIVLAAWLGEIVRFATDKGSCGSPVMTADTKMNLPQGAESPDPTPGKPQFQKNSYARELRAVGASPGGSARVFLGLGTEGRLLRCPRQGNRCRLSAVVVFRLHSRLRLGSWIGSHRRPSPVDL